MRTREPRVYERAARRHFPESRPVEAVNKNPYCHECHRRLRAVADMIETGLALYKGFSEADGAWHLPMDRRKGADRAANAAIIDYDGSQIKGKAE